ncbi:MAG: TrkA family potassium uptake protein [Desulfobacterales bacterium]|nr:TrkA family potassium uptake protein [Desulfobacterales bacterium]
MKVLIVGGGKTLYFICRNFIAKGYEVVIINRKKDECIQLARQLSAMVICGDGSDAAILKDAGIIGADAVLAITPNDQDNLVICQLASLKFGVTKVLAMANDPDNTEIFEKLGVSAFSTTQIVGSLIEQRASLEQVLNLMSVGEGRVNVTEIILDVDSPVAGKVLKDIDLPENALIAVLIRDNQPIVPRGANNLLAGDRLVLITLPENHGSALKVFTGESQQRGNGFEGKRVS